MKQARSDSEQHCSTTDLSDHGAFPVQICNTDPQLIRIRFKSRHSNQRTYYTYLKFTGETIENSCCDWPNGDRKVGICSHRVAAIWVLGYQRHCNGILTYQPSSSCLKHLDDSELVDDFVEFIGCSQ